MHNEGEKVYVTLTRAVTIMKSPGGRDLVKIIELFKAEFPEKLKASLNGAWHITTMHFSLVK